MDIELTQNAEYLLCVLYKAYVERSKSDELADAAAYFGDSEDIQEDYLTDWTTDKIDNAVYELSRKGFMAILPGDDTICQSALSNAGIAYMEHRFGHKLDTLLQRLATLRTVLRG